MSTTIIKNVSKGGLVLPLGKGDSAMIAPGEEVPVSTEALDGARKLPVVAAWFDEGRLVTVGGEAKPDAKPAKSKTVKVEG